MEHATCKRRTVARLLKFDSGLGHINYEPVDPIRLCSGHAKAAAIFVS